MKERWRGKSYGMERQRRREKERDGVRRMEGRNGQSRRLWEGRVVEIWGGRGEYGISKEGGEGYWWIQGVARN